VLEQGVDWSVRADGGHLHYQERGVETAYPLPVLPGAHQIDNAGTAIAALRHLGDLTPDDAAVAAGLETAIWPARLQRLTKGSLVEKLPDDWELWLDGGHNPAAGQILAIHAASAWRGMPLHLVTGMMNSKAAGDFLAPLKDRAESIAAVAIPGEANSFSAADLAHIAGGRAEASVADAIRHIVASHPGPARVLICGSLYLAGTILADNQ
jgi:dihydrofolate synthase/folylpolyglutamate synthase